MDEMHAPKVKPVFVRTSLVEKDPYEEEKEEEESASFGQKDIWNEENAAPMTEIRELQEEDGLIVHEDYNSSEEEIERTVA